MNIKKFLPVLVGGVAGFVCVRLFSGVGFFVILPLFLVAYAGYTLKTTLKNPYKYSPLEGNDFSSGMLRLKADLEHLGFRAGQCFRSTEGHLLLPFVHQEKPIRAFVHETNTFPKALSFNFDSHVEGANVDLTTSRGRCAMPAVDGEYSQYKPSGSVTEIFLRHQDGMNHLELLGFSFTPVIYPDAEALNEEHERMFGEMHSAFQRNPIFHSFNCFAQSFLTTDSRYKPLEAQLTGDHSNPLKWVGLGLAGILLLGWMAVAGAKSFVHNMVVTDSDQVIQIFRQVVPGASAPTGYSGAMAVRNPADGTIQASITTDKFVPYEGVPKAMEDKVLKFQVRSFRHNGSELAINLTWDSMRISDAGGREVIAENEAELTVGGERLKVKKLTSRDENGKQYLEYRIDIPKGDEMAFLLISGVEANFDSAAMQEFLDGLEPLSKD
jgi:hypothetical protein